MEREAITEIVKQVISEMTAPQLGITRHKASEKICSSETGLEHQVPIEASARHVHLCQADIDTLFGKGYQLTVKKNLSQPGEFLARERVKILGERSIIENVAVLGPARKQTQVEVSLSDAFTLGIEPPINLSGNLNGAADVVIINGVNTVNAKSSTIIARNHIHMTPEEAETFGVKDRQEVNVKVTGVRPMTFENVVIRVDKSFSLAMHIDLDEANACGEKFGIKAEIIGLSADTPKPASIGKKLHDKPAVNRLEYNEKLLNEAQASKYSIHEGAELCMPAKTIVTPAAKDMLRKYKIAIKVIK